MNDEPRSVDASQVFARLTKRIGELTGDYETRIAVLESRNADLEAQVAALRLHDEAETIDGMILESD